MNRREKRVVIERGVYQVIEIEFFDNHTNRVVDTSFEVRKMEKFLVEFENEDEALSQLEFMLSLDEMPDKSAPRH